MIASPIFSVARTLTKHTRTRKSGSRHKSNAVHPHSQRGRGSIGIRSAIRFSEVHDGRRFNRAA